MSNTFSNIGWIIAILVFIGAGIALFINARRARPEIGSEIELAPNRKPFLQDDELETTKLDRTLLLGLAFLAVIGVTLPLYWLYEPARQEGAVQQMDATFVARGLKIYDETAKCAECHGPKGVGGAKETAILNDNGDFVSQVKWQAPALNTVLYRYSTDEVKFILNYGRGNTPMPAWGAPGGGPLTEQQLDSVIAYIRSIQLPASEARAELDKEIELVCKPERQDDGSLKGVNPKCTVNDPTSPNKQKSWNTLGEALFNLGYYDGFSGGAFSCARCHTKGWSYGQAENPGGGFLGPNLTNGSELRQFETADAQVNYVSLGSIAGAKYGRGGLSGAGQMPGFGKNPNTDPKAGLVPPVQKMDATQTMYLEDQIKAIVTYERGL
ncbi:MAG: c-type cytochrome [Actinobacteria bacterium]|nr:c-type cytochrome [Actinomycetota bacterium]